jgi:excinuclease UvrABC nuclease subunit
VFINHDKLQNQTVLKPLTKQEKTKKIIETETRTINKGTSTQSINLLKHFRTYLAILEATEIELRTIKETDQDGKIEVYLEARILKEKTKNE